MGKEKAGGPGDRTETSYVMRVLSYFETGSLVVGIVDSADAIGSTEGCRFKLVANGTQLHA